MRKMFMKAWILIELNYFVALWIIRSFLSRERCTISFQEFCRLPNGILISTLLISNIMPKGVENWCGIKFHYAIGFLFHFLKDISHQKSYFVTTSFTSRSTKLLNYLLSSEMLHLSSVVRVAMFSSTSITLLRLSLLISSHTLPLTT